MDTPTPGWTISDWRLAVTSGRFSEIEYVKWLRQFTIDDPAWIYLAPEACVLEQLNALSHRLKTARQYPNELPLFGVPFAVKDNIDVKDWPTTAACPAFRYVADEDATVVSLLRNAGAIVVGKTNLDQFATGLVGTRTPYGTCTSAFDTQYIAGGSSSGSASVVTRGLLPFTLGTDTAGSGRVPAAFGNVIGYKPTRGVVSTKGVVPACRTLDCVSVFALTTLDAALVGRILREYDEEDPYGRHFEVDEPTVQEAEKGEEKLVRPRIGVFEHLEFFSDRLARFAYDQSIACLTQAGWEFVEINPQPFFELAEILYGGAWIAERALTVGGLLERPELMDETVRTILLPARSLSAEDAFRSEYKRAQLASQIRSSMSGLDGVLVPTTPTTYRIDEVKADPLLKNARLGTYTNFTNLADLAAVALPGRFRDDGLPAGLTLLGPAFSDDRLLALSAAAHELMHVPLGSTSRHLPELVRAAETIAPPASGTLSTQRGNSWLPLVVVGAHLRGMALNHQLTERGARFVRATRTSERYKLIVLSGQEVLKPGLIRVEDGGAKIFVEVWEIPVANLASFVCDILPPLGLGTLELADGTWEKGFICEPCAMANSLDITSYGGFAAYLESQRPPLTAPQE